MGLIKDIEYFNCFLAKKVVETGAAGPGKATWPSFPWNPTGYPTFPLEASTNETNVLFDWYVEEARIRGGYNNTIVDLGVKAFISESEDTELTLSNGLIYSGLYNSRTGLNETNVFATGENITKELDPRYGGIQKLYTTDTNLIIFQEDKVSNALVDKDAIYSADGNQTLTATQLVLVTWTAAGINLSTMCVNLWPLQLAVGLVLAQFRRLWGHRDTQAAKRGSFWAHKFERELPF